MKLARDQGRTAGKLAGFLPPCWETGTSLMGAGVTWEEGVATGV